jgi:hypothetical protein
LTHFFYFSYIISFLKFTIYDRVKYIQSSSVAVVVDLVDEQERNIIYDFNNGWSPIDENWAKVIPSNGNLVEVLNPYGI